MTTDQVNTTTTNSIPSTSKLKVVGIDLNTILIIALAIGGYWYINKDKVKEPVVPAEVILKDEAIALSDMFSQGIPILRAGLYKTDVDLGKAVENFSLIYFQDLTTPAKQWLDSARVRIGEAIGSKDLEQSKILSPVDRENAIRMFRQLSEEARTLAG
jgi:hypothetical protein